ncbi:MAG: CAP domain-containing protein [Desulfitobacterium hafniense]|nr:CAP domain-containing protein [Desulfitobacterium hafniense]
MKKILLGFQTFVLLAAIALPAQAAINIGTTTTTSGSVVKINSYGTVVSKPQPTSTSPVTTTVSPTPSNTAPSTTSTTTQTVPKITTQTGSLISLKYLLAKSSPVTAPTQTSPAPTTSAPTTPAPAPTPTPVPAPTTPAPAPTQPAIPPATSLTADEQLMIDMVNKERTAAGLKPLAADLRLVAVARAKANDMKVNNYFDHTSPTFGSPWAMMTKVGISYKWAGENIAGNKSVAGAMSNWMNSAGHRANILDPKFTHIGVGMAYGSAYGNLYVQEFAQE